MRRDSAVKTMPSHICAYISVTVEKPSAEAAPPGHIVSDRWRCVARLWGWALRWTNVFLLWLRLPAASHGSSGVPSKFPRGCPDYCAVVAGPSSQLQTVSGLACESPACAVFVVLSGQRVYVPPRHAPAPIWSFAVGGPAIAFKRPWRFRPGEGAALLEPRAQPSRRGDPSALAGAPALSHR